MLQDDMIGMGIMPLARKRNEAAIAPIAAPKAVNKRGKGLEWVPVKYE